MNTKRILSSIGVGAGAIILGLGIQYAVAAWSSAPASPPNSNVAAPINVSGGGESGTAVYSQVKTGLLTLENLAAVNLNVSAGASTTPNTVLTNDGSGNASWQMAAGGGSSGHTILNMYNAVATSSVEVSITLTPASASSKFLIIGEAASGNGDNGGNCDVGLYRGSTALIGEFSTAQFSNGDIAPTGVTYIDTPNTTSSVTYKIKHVDTYTCYTPGTSAASSMSILEIN